MTSPSVWNKNKWAVRFKADAKDRPVKFSVVTLTWDEKSFEVKTQRGELPQDAKQMPL